MLTLGAATADITPPPGAMMACFPRDGRARRARGAHDPLRAKALVLGDVAAALVPGEPFVAVQTRFKQAVASAAGLLAAYANAWCGYLPYREDYAHGGYGVAEDRAFADAPPEYSFTAAPVGTAERVQAELAALARRVRSFDPIG